MIFFARFHFHTGGVLYAIASELIAMFASRFLRSTMLGFVDGVDGAAVATLRCLALLLWYSLWCHDGA
jgi:hypothetical protein